MSSERSTRGKAEAEVLAVRGSYDAPGFDACVEAAMEETRDEARIKVVIDDLRIDMTMDNADTDTPGAWSYSTGWNDALDAVLKEMEAYSSSGGGGI